MKTLLISAALGAALATPAFAVDPGQDPQHDHRHGARTAKAERRADPAHMTLVQAAQYISAQVPGEIRQVEAHPGASVYRVDVDLVNGARACLDVNAHNGAVSWHETPALPH